MSARFVNQAVLAMLLIWQLPVCLGTETADTSESNRYLDAVREFADNVLKYGRDTYGPKHTPLFVDGLNIHTHEPVKWIDSDGTKWILSNLASQQNLFRTLDGLTKMTGDPKYRQAAVEAIEYAFENLRSPNGLLYWGARSAYDVQADEVCGNRNHVFKCHYPYYELMWRVDQKATEDLIGSIWSAHILDWSNLDMNRIASTITPLEKPWRHEYRGGPAPFEGQGISVVSTGSDLCHAAATLFMLSGERQLLVWSNRLAQRYVQTRNPKTGISGYGYTRMKADGAQYQIGEDFKGHAVYGDTIFAPYPKSESKRDNPQAWAYRTRAWICLLLLGDQLGLEGQEFRQWSLEEFTAWGRAAYRKEDNCFVPMLTDGTSLEGYTLKRDGNYGAKGMAFKPLSACPLHLWAYSLAYRVAGDKFMWQMVRDIALGIGLGDIGQSPSDYQTLQLHTDSSDPYILSAFLELHRKTNKEIFLKMAAKIGDNILDKRFHKGFFAPSNKHTYTRLDYTEPLVLLHLDAIVNARRTSLPPVWPSESLFVGAYRGLDFAFDIVLIYPLIELTEPPVSLHEAAALGDVEKAKALIASGTDVNARVQFFTRAPLHFASINGRKKIVELLLSKGADIDARDGYVSSALHYAVEKGHKGIIELLITKGADINAKNNNGYTPIDLAIGRDREKIVEVLVAKGADDTIHLAAYDGNVDKVRSFLQKGIDVNVRIVNQVTLLHIVVKGGHQHVAEILIANGADVNARNANGATPLYTAAKGGHRHAAEILIANGADVNAKDNRGKTPLRNAIQEGHKEVAELLIAKGADINGRDKWGHTPLYYAIWGKDKDMVKLLVTKGADVNVTPADEWLPLCYAVWNEDRDINVDFIFVNGAKKDEMDWTPLHWAVSVGQEDVAEYLIGKGADIHARTEDNRMPLHNAALGGSRAVVELLVAKGADVNCSGVNGQTPLHLSVRQGHKDTVELLIAKGADVNVKNKWGKTPLDIAVDRGYIEIAELLRKHGAKEQSGASRANSPIRQAFIVGVELPD